MPSATDDAKPAPAPAPAAPPRLPPNVKIFSPRDAGAAEALLHGRVFTRLEASGGTAPGRLAAALAADEGVDEGFCLAHRGAVLIFDADREAHHEHFRSVCLALRDADVGLSVSGCVHDAPEAPRAGFQLEALGPGSVLVIDLMCGGDDDDDDEDGGDEAEGEEEDEEASLAALLGGESAAIVS